MVGVPVHFRVGLVLEISFALSCKLSSSTVEPGTPADRLGDRRTPGSRRSGPGPDPAGGGRRSHGHLNRLRLRAADSERELGVCTEPPEREIGAQSAAVWPASRPRPAGPRQSPGPDSAGGRRSGCLSCGQCGRRTGRREQAAIFGRPRT